MPVRRDAEDGWVMPRIPALTMLMTPSGFPVTWILRIDGELSHVGESLVAWSRGLRETAGVRQVERALFCAHVPIDQAICKITQKWCFVRGKSRI